MSRSEVLTTKHFMMEKKATADNFDEAREMLCKLGIKTAYDSTRMIFSTTHAHKNLLANTYTQECNGLILELGTWKPLMVPPRCLRFNIDTDKANKFLHQGLYHIYKAEDGTCFNMYFYNNKWIISTAKGYEMNAVVWETLSYQEIIEECLSKIGMTWETFTEQLDKTRCYSFGFKHPQFHRFYEGQASALYKIWFIQSVDLNESSPLYLWASDKCSIAAIKPQEYYKTPVGNLRDLYKLASAALNDYLKSKTLCYGFILRSNNFEETRDNSDLFIESSLMRSIRKFWYENTVVESCRNNNISKELMVSLNAYLDKKTYELFLLLFPQYSTKFSTYSDVVANLVDIMILNRSEDPALKEVAFNIYTNFITSVKYDINSKNEEQKRRVLSEYVMHPANLYKLIPLLT